MVIGVNGLAEWQRRARLPLHLVCLARWRRWLCDFDLYMALVGRSGIGVVGALKRIGVRQLDGERRAVVGHDNGR